MSSSSSVGGTSGAKGVLQQQQQQRTSSPDAFSNSAVASSAWIAAPSGRRLLPSPVHKQESEKARNVRMLLAKHQEQVNQLLHLRASRDKGAEAVPSKRQQSASLRSEVPDQNSAAVNFKYDNNEVNCWDQDDEDDPNCCSSHLPGNSFPATSPVLVSSSIADADEEMDDGEELIKRLRLGQTRMEQIKRMLVNQRGCIVELLRRLAQSNMEDNQRRNQHQVIISPTCANCSPETEHQETLVGRNNLNDALLNVAEDEASSKLFPKDQDRLCPMCEAIFPGDTDSDELELHVMDHFSMEDPETLLYLPHEQDQPVHHHQ